nr:recombinase family protein [Rhizorhabdus wittichii]
MGYDLRDRKLLINETEAEIVRRIFTRHVELGSIRELAEELEATGVRSKLRTMQDGRVVGGTPYSDGALAYLLRNVLYIGNIRHGDQVYDGEHQAIISPELWEANQQLFAKASNEPRPRKSLPSPLNGFLEDELGRVMGPAHGNRGSRRYRYYVSRSSTEHSEAPWRIPAADLEAVVERGLTGFLNDPLRRSAELGEAARAEVEEPVANRLVDMVGNAASLSRMLDSLDARIIVRQEVISILLDPAKLLEMLCCGGRTDRDEPIAIDIAVQMKRRGHELKLIYAAPEARPAMRDDRLIQLLGQGRIAYQQLLSGGLTGSARAHAVRLARLQFLAPDIVTAIFEGRQPIELNTRTLLRTSELPIEWKEQRKVLGFA